MGQRPLSCRPSIAVEGRFLREPRERRMAADSRNFWAHGLPARERCHSACLSRIARRSVFIEALQEGSPCWSKTVPGGQPGDLPVRRRAGFTKGKNACEVFCAAHAERDHGVVRQNACLHHVVQQLGNLFHAQSIVTDVRSLKGKGMPRWVPKPGDIVTNRWCVTSLDRAGYPSLSGHSG